MYCVKCGVELADTEEICPLCQTKVFHPEIVRKNEESLYPENIYPIQKKKTYWYQGLIIAGFLLPIFIVLLCDFQYNQEITWSNLVVGALIIFYIICVLPTWFTRPNPVIFIPCDFAAIAIYLLYIDVIMKGDWFLSFAFPVIGYVGAVIVTVITLLWYVRKGKFFIFGGAFIALGLFMPLMEFLISITFENIKFIGWSYYPLIFLIIVGGMLIFLGICRPARETMERKFFI